MNDSDESDARARGAAVAATRPVPSAEQLPDPQTTTVQATPVQVAPAIEATPPASDASHPVAPPAASSDGESPALGSDR
jgi:hypothetical protein